MPEIVKKPKNKNIVWYESDKELWEEEYLMISDTLDRYDRGEIELDEQFVTKERAELEDLKQKLNIK